MKLCVYVATTNNGGNVVGFTSVQIFLTFTANGSINDVQISAYYKVGVASLTDTETFPGGLIAFACDGATTISQVRSMMANLVCVLELHHTNAIVSPYFHRA